MIKTSSLDKNKQSSYAGHGKITIKSWQALISSSSLSLKVYVEDKILICYNDMWVKRYCGPHFAQVPGLKV